MVSSSMQEKEKAPRPECATFFDHLWGNAKENFNGAITTDSAQGSQRIDPSTAHGEERSS